jgi:hypothetical protein
MACLLRGGSDAVAKDVQAPSGRSEAAGHPGNVRPSLEIRVPGLTPLELAGANVRYRCNRLQPDGHP